MVREEEPKNSSPQNPNPRKPQGPKNNGDESMFSPGFRSVAEMAGWDEEALLIASLVVEDTPDRNPNNTKHKKRSVLHFKTPPTNSRRKRMSQRKSAALIAVPVLDLDQTDQTLTEENEKKIDKAKEHEEKKIGEAEENKLFDLAANVSSSSLSLPCMDRLREELSCAICLEICFEPSTTVCGHSFCKKCLRSAADKCGKRCPKCRQLISNGRSCTVNTVLWNTIQLLFPQEVENKRELLKTQRSTREAEDQTPARRSYYNARNHSIMALNSPENEGIRVQVSRRGNVRARQRRGAATQDEDAALALRLQREEFMEAFRGSSDEQQQYTTSSSSLNLARANLRAMASRAVSIRNRGQER